MKERKISLGKRLDFIMLMHYINWKRFVFGITINYEDEYFNNSTKRGKIEFNIWLLIISFHIAIYLNHKSLKKESDKNE